MLRVKGKRGKCGSWTHMRMQHGAGGEATSGGVLGSLGGESGELAFT